MRVLVLFFLLTNLVIRQQSAHADFSDDFPSAINQAAPLPISLDGGLTARLDLAAPDAARELGQRLRYAARTGRVRVLHDLLASGAAIDARGEYGETALQAAARWGHLKAAQYLLTQGANPNLADDAGQTALIMAAKDCAHRSIRALIVSGAKVDVVNQFGKSAIFFPAESGCVNAVAALVETAPDINLSLLDDSGRTALDYALDAAQSEVGGPFIEIARLLLNLGARFTTWYPANEFNLGPQPKGDLGPRDQRL